MPSYKNNQAKHCFRKLGDTVKSELKGAVNDDLSLSCTGNTINNTSVKRNKRRKSEMNCTEGTENRNKKQTFEPIYQESEIIIDIPTTSPSIDIPDKNKTKITLPNSISSDDSIGPTKKRKKYKSRPSSYEIYGSPIIQNNFRTFVVPDKINFEPNFCAELSDEQNGNCIIHINNQANRETIISPVSGPVLINQLAIIRATTQNISPIQYIDIPLFVPDTHVDVVRNDDPEESRNDIIIDIKSTLSTEMFPEKTLENIATVDVLAEKDVPCIDEQTDEYVVTLMDRDTVIQDTITQDTVIQDTVIQDTKKDDIERDQVDLESSEPENKLDLDIVCGKSENKKYINNIQEVSDMEEKNMDRVAKQNNYTIIKNFKHIISRFKVLSELKGGYKIWMDNDKQNDTVVFKIDDCYVPFLSRYLWSQNREKIINVVIEDTNYILQNLNSLDKKRKDTVIFTVGAALNGIRNMKQTYTNHQQSLDKVITSLEELISANESAKQK
ncbi:MAG: hypothetical protein Dasosvirus9_8 [Dasosvirus sp.]|uniref:Uncharacterized protein n=1 Tax=Dasosvirus sp. TaxID=2487764 RepID=A0A3G4ZTD7_9VIRU|nr:MAG: hypothetical protein Dasosvirus9_8 [Dasosvirus sp.]